MDFSDFNKFRRGASSTSGYHWSSSRYTIAEIDEEIAINMEENDSDDSSSSSIDDDNESHLEFAPEEMASDGSDYMRSSEEEDNMSINSENYDMEIDTFPKSRILRRCNAVFDPPKQPDWSEMSLEALEDLIQQHRESRTVRHFLCEIDTESEYYQGYYFDIDRKDIPSTRGLAANEKVQVVRYLKQKIYYTMLGFACMDRDGERREAKIKLILQTAKLHQIKMRKFLATYGEIRLSRSSRRDHWQKDDFWQKQETTPLHSLISNQLATSESLRLICNAWPRVVHVRGNDYDGTNTILMYLVEECSYQHEIERLQSFSDVLFESAEKTKEGARGLVLASDMINVGVDSYFEDEEENEREKTVIHVAATRYSNPEDVLPIFLKWWPEALKHSDRSFFGLFHQSLVRSYESLVKSIAAFIQYSSLDALAAGLLCDDIQDGYGFDRFMQVLESPGVNITRCRHLRVVVSWQSHLVNIVDHLLRRKDDHGRSILHYIAAYDVIDDGWLQYGRTHDVESKIRKDYQELGRDFPQQRTWNEREDEEEGRRLAILQWWKRRKSR
ncbi:hypothetical protein ACHAXR_009690 [Thalassiosira sp. AJA248-18]